MAGPVLQPTPQHRLASAKELLVWVAEHIAALQSCLAQPETLKQREAVLPLLQADLELWQRIDAFGRQEQSRWLRACAATISANQTGTAGMGRPRVTERRPRMRPRSHPRRMAD